MNKTKEKVKELIEGKTSRFKDRKSFEDHIKKINGIIQVDKEFLEYGVIVPKDKPDSAKVIATWKSDGDAFEMTMI